MIRNIIFIIMGFLLGVFLTSSLSWRDIDFDNLRQHPWQEVTRLRGIVTERPQISSNSAVVTKVLKGDSVLIEGGDEVILLGIIADEAGEPCYQTAKDKLSELTLGKKATLVKDVSDKDETGHLLRYLKIGDTNINVELTKLGLVSLKTDNNVTMYKNDLIFAEQIAKNGTTGCKWKNQ
jgi:endonuclease YncB( thermonuclease family)